MSNSANLAETFQSIVNALGQSESPYGETQYPAEIACMEFQNALSETILPRRITARGNDGSRLSVLAKNRRVIKVAEVHPPELWDGENAPHETECETDFNTFAGPFASALIKVVGDDGIRIERSLLSDRLGKTKPGYPAAMLAGHVKKSNNQNGGKSNVGRLFRTFPDLTRALFSDEVDVRIGISSRITEDWMQTRVADLRKDLNPADPDLRFIVIDGDAPLGLALLWFEGEGCIVVSETPRDIGKLERYVGALGRYL